MIKVIYCQDGEVISDFIAFEFVNRKIQDYKNNPQNDLEVRIANEVPFNIFVLRVMEEVISASEIEFYSENVRLNWDEYLGVELLNENDEFGVNLPVINKIIHIGAEKRLTEMKSRKNQDIIEVEKHWKEIQEAAKTMSGSKFRCWCDKIPQIKVKSSAEDDFEIDGTKIIWEIEVQLNGKLLICYYDKNDTLVKICLRD